MSADVAFYAKALIGAMEAALDRGALSEEGTDAAREIIKRLRQELKQAAQHERLIAAAPGLLEALQMAQVIVEQYGNDAATRMIRRAIKKAIEGDE